MKQIVTAGLLALGIHGLLLGINFRWPGRMFPERSKPLALNMTLTSMPIKKTVKDSLQKPKPVFKQTTKVKKTPKKKHNLKTPLHKRIQIPVPSNKSAVIKAIPAEIVKKTESRLDSEQTASKELLKAAKQTDAMHSALKMVHEARPMYRLNPSPKYPRIARIRGYQGNVLLDVLVNIDGKVDDLKIHKSSGHPLLDRAATSSVKNWLFEPGMIGEEKVNMWVRVPIRFELKE